MKLRYNEKIININKFEDEIYKTSVFTGNKLKSITALVSTNEKERTLLSEIIKNCNEGGLYEIDDDNTTLAEYKCIQSSYSYQSSNNIIYNYTLELEQVEHNLIEELKLRDISTKPYKYDESYDNGIIITLRVRLNKEKYYAFRKLQFNSTYFNVTRLGINSTPIQMRFGKIIWSKHKDYFKVEFTLVEKSCDELGEENPFNSILNPELNNIQHKIIYQELLNNQLIDILLSKNILCEDEVENIKANIRAAFDDTYQTLYKVDDIDQC